MVSDDNMDYVAGEKELECAISMIESSSDKLSEQNQNAINYVVALGTIPGTLNSPSSTDRKSARSTNVTARTTSATRCESVRASTQIDTSRARSTKTTARTGRSASTSRSEPNKLLETPPAFKTWPSSSSSCDESYKVGPFVLLLLNEFCRQYDLVDTATALQHELERYNVSIPPADLWVEMYNKCQSILNRRSSSHANSTIEKLIDFCVNPHERKALFSLEMVQAYNPTTVCVSPKHPVTGSVPKYSLMNAHIQLRSPIIRPSQRLSNNPSPSTSPTRSGGFVSETVPNQQNNTQYEAQEQRDTSSHSPPSSTKHGKKKKSRDNLTRGQQAKLRAQILASQQSNKHHAVAYDDNGNPTHMLHSGTVLATYGAPGLADVVKSQAKRDFKAHWLLEREIRRIRRESINMEPPTPTKQALDPYETELILERFELSKRQGCALCQVEYLLYNLPHRVSFKCIMDVYDHWAYVPTDRYTASKYKSPLCYDPVNVCRMCAQIIFEHSAQPENASSPTSQKKIKRIGQTKSMSNLHLPTIDKTFQSSSTDPYSLPPLASEDMYDHGIEPQLRPTKRHPRNRLVSENGADEGTGRSSSQGNLTESRGGVSPAKGMVYDYQNHPLSDHTMSTREWEIIHPTKSTVRQVMEDTIPIPSQPTSILATILRQTH